VTQMKDLGVVLLPIRQSSYIAAPPAQVWGCLTTASGWDAWFTKGTTIDLKAGGSIRLRWEGFAGEPTVIEDGGPILELEEGKRLVFQWSPAGHPTTVALDLAPRGPGTQVTVTESGYGTDEPDLAAYAACATGWGEAITLLKFYLEYGHTYGPVPRR
jgi:uncharacterized protein YndB with AHSA1/START domain